MALQGGLQGVAHQVHIGFALPAGDAAVVGRAGLGAQDELHPRHIGGHGLRQADLTQIGEGERGHPLADAVKHHAHDEALEPQGHDLEQGIGLVVYIGGEDGPHVFLGDGELHLVVDDLHQLLKAVIPQAGVHADVGHGHEVAHGVAAVELAQVHRDLHLHGVTAPPVGLLGSLHVQQGLEQHRGEIGRHRDAQSLGTGMESVAFQNAAGHVEEAVRLQLPLGAVDVAAVPGRGHRSGGFLEAVRKFLGAGSFVEILDPLFGGDLYPIAQADILRRQIFGKDKAAGAVGDGVEELHRHPVPVVEHPDGASAHVRQRHAHQGLGAVLPHPGRALQLLQIVPEGAAPQTDADGREARRHMVQGLLEQGRVHRVREGKGDAEGVAPVLSAGKRGR